MPLNKETKPFQVVLLLYIYIYSSLQIQLYKENKKF